MDYKFLIFFSALFFSACGDPPENLPEYPEPKGGRAYGGTLKVNETDKYISLYPHHIADIISYNIANQIYEGLVKFNSKNVNEVLPSIADKWDISPDGLTYTFYLKSGVKFHDDPCFPNGKGRIVNAMDFKYSFELLCTAGTSSQFFEFKKLVKGADNYYEASKKGKPSFEIDGLKVVDEHTIQLILNFPSSNFLYILAGPAGFVMPREAVEKYGEKNRIGTGPFIYKENSGENILLLRNPHYHRTDSFGNRLPFLDTIQISFIGNKAKELEEFKKGNIHLIFGLPSGSISEMVEQQLADFNSKNPKYFLHRTPELMTQYYQFNVIKKPFDDVRVRKAFSYAIDRDKIISDVLNTEAYGPGICGITPPGISGYDITEIKGYNFNPEKAKKLLAEAGYPNGRGFPKITIETNSGGGKYVDLVEEVKTQLKKVLNVEVDFVVVPFKQKLEDAKYARADIFRSGWMADYPSPENFLRLLYGEYVPATLEEPSYPNTIRYKNSMADSLLKLGFTASSQKQAYDYFKTAEKLIMEDAPFIVLWYGENLKMIHSYVKGFYFNPMNYKDFSETYIQKTNTENESNP